MKLTLHLLMLAFATCTGTMVLKSAGIERIEESDEERVETSLEEDSQVWAYNNHPCYEIKLTYLKNGKSTHLSLKPGENNYLGNAGEITSITSFHEGYKANEKVPTYFEDFLEKGHDLLISVGGLAWDEYTNVRTGFMKSYLKDMPKLLKFDTGKYWR